jgi:MOSC domain-containing protein YiiM
MAVKLISVNVGLPREVQWRGRTVRTSIWKSPVEGRRHVGRFNVDGDRQADLRIHGGTQKAVYVYPSEHYAYWREELGEDLSWGAFGENLTLEGLLERDVATGDRLTIGTAEFMVSQPRTPCFKLMIRFGRDDMIQRFRAARRPGFYLSVVREGEVGAGDDIAITTSAT